MPDSEGRHLLPEDLGSGEPVSGLRPKIIRNLNDADDVACYFMSREFAAFLLIVYNGDSIDMLSMRLFFFFHSLPSALKYTKHIFNFGFKKALL